MAEEDRSAGTIDDPLDVALAWIVFTIIFVTATFVFPVLIFRAMYLSTKRGFLEYMNPNQVGKSSSGFEGT